MKRISANPDLIETAVAWFDAHPLALMVAGTIALAVICYRFKDMI